MAKGRKQLTQSRSERYLGSYSSYSQAQESSTELAEDDVWSSMVAEERDDNLDSESAWSPHVSGGRESTLGRGGGMGMTSFSSSHVRKGGLSLAFVEDTSGGGGRIDTPNSPRIVHQFRNSGGGHDVGSPLGGGGGGRHVATSLPVNVPDWSKILRADSVDSMFEYYGGDDDGMHSSNDPEMIPPHEYLAREYTRGATSVFEGVGRTLKGRDMRRVRDAVWSRTGFDG